MIWYMMACAVMAALLCLTLAATRIPTPIAAALDVASLIWLAAVGCLALGVGA